MSMVPTCMAEGKERMRSCGKEPFVTQGLPVDLRSIFGSIFVERNTT